LYLAEEVVWYVLKMAGNYATILRSGSIKGIGNRGKRGSGMDEKVKRVSVEDFKNIIGILTPSMDDYLYIYDLRRDYYCISPSAMERFRMPSIEFNRVPETMATFTYAEDVAILHEDLRQILNKEKDSRNIQYRWIGRDGEPVWINARGNVLYDENGEAEFVAGCINEIGRKQKADNVSGLLGESSLQLELKMRGLGSRLEGFVLRLGIDNFKEINENKGMEYGDMILRKTAECIGSVIHSDEKLYRIVADEFAVVDFSGRSAEEAHEIYNEIRRRIDAFIEENCYEVFFTISAGVLEFGGVKNQTYYNLMKLSEFSLNEAKNNGRNKHYIYDPRDYLAFLHKRELLHIIRHSVNEDFKGFETYYQPIVDIRENRLYSAETLLRFQSDSMGRVSPVEFIPILEDSGLIIPVGKWVLHQAMCACAKIQKEIPGFKMSVNLSYVQVLKSNVLSEILAGVEKYGLAPESIIVELTESGFFEANANFNNFCEGLKANGIPLALDDFGTGYSNFHYLYNLSPSTIKIDRSFTLKALNNDYEYNLLQHMADMTHSIDTKFCIEGIETEDELNRICNMGPDYIQGFYFAQPCPLDKFLETMHGFV